MAGRTRRRRLEPFDLFNYAFFLVVMVLMIYPFWHTIVGSFMTLSEYYRKLFLLYPSHPTLKNYSSIFQKGDIWAPMFNTIYITIVGTAASLAFTIYVSYGLSKKFMGSKFVMQFIVLTMIINPGLIPQYLLYMSLGMIDHYSVYILPSLTYPFFIIIARTFFRSMPNELEDASKIDGCNEFGHFFRIALPLSKPLLATIGLFLAVNYWNTLFQSLFFVSSDSRQTLQAYLYSLIHDNQTQQTYSQRVVFSDTTKLANIVIATAPILFVYPFLQKYFVRGLTIGAVKG